MWDILSKTSIQGLNYFSDLKKTFFARFFWLFAFVLGTSGFIYYGYIAYIKFKVEPQISLSNKLKSIREVPFPAVTICPPFMTTSSRFGIIESKWNLNKTNPDLIKNIALLEACNPEWLIENSKDDLKDITYDVINALNNSAFSITVSN